MEPTDARSLRRTGTKRKNTSIPLPVPVPHLIKKSRGRKVPYVPVPVPVGVDGGDDGMGSGDGMGVDNSPSSSTTSGQTSFNTQSAFDSPSSSPLQSLPRPIRGARRSSSSSGSTGPAAYSLGEGGKRTYMCEVPGCGKCFVRGEHLKRHVRSIHTWDKREFLVCLSLGLRLGFGFLVVSD